MKYEHFNQIDLESMEKNGIDDLLLEDETVLWRAKPKKSAFIINKVFAMLPIALLWLAFDGAFIGIMLQSEIPSEMLWFLIPFFALHLTPVWIWVANVLTASKRYSIAEYAATDKRILIRSGFVGVNFENILYKDIDHVNLKIGFIDKMLKVGDIYLYTKGDNSDSKKNGIILDVENPYEVYNKLQKIVLDIQTDMSYPNDLRPTKNAGYKTAYSPDDENKE